MSFFSFNSALYNKKLLYCTLIFSINICPIEVELGFNYYNSTSVSSLFLFFFCCFFSFFSFFPSGMFACFLCFYSLPNCIFLEFMPQYFERTYIHTYNWINFQEHSLHLENDDWITESLILQESHTCQDKYSSYI